MSKSDQQAKRDQWNKYIDEHEKSGLSQVEFCKQNNLSTAQFGYYKGLRKTQQKPAGTFSPVKVNALLNTAEIRLTLPNGFQCVLPCNLDKAQIKNLMEVLLSC